MMRSAGYMLKELGCLIDANGYLSEMADWIKELGEYRAEKDEELLVLSIPVMGPKGAIKKSPRRRTDDHHERRLGRDKEERQEGCLLSYY